MVSHPLATTWKIPDLSIIIINTNTRALLTKCLESLPTACGSLAYEILVIDNASVDGSAESVRKHFSEVKLIVNNENVGYAYENNQAAREASGRYLLLLNPDTEASANSISGLVEYADRHTDIAVIGPRLLNSDGSHQRSCWRGYPGLSMALIDALYLWKLPWLPLTRFSEYRPNELLEPREVDHLLGACLLISRQAWLEIGPLNEHYFLFLNETDWCYRAKQAGWRIVYYPHVSIIHHGQQSIRQQPQRKLPLLYRGYCLFYRNHHSGSMIGLLSLKAIIAGASILRIGLWTFRILRSHTNDAREQGRKMVGGYFQVLRELPSF